MLVFKNGVYMKGNRSRYKLVLDDTWKNKSEMLIKDSLVK